MLFQKLPTLRNKRKKRKMRNSYDNNDVENVGKRNQNDKKKVNKCAYFFGRCL